MRRIVLPHQECLKWKPTTASSDASGKHSGRFTRASTTICPARNTAAWVLVVVLMVLAVVGVLAWSLVSGGEVEAQPATTIGQGE